MVRASTRLCRGRRGRGAEATAFALAGAALLVACTAEPESGPPAAEPEAVEAMAAPEVSPPQYSPFVVQVEGEAPFREITFKQVGSFQSEVDRAHLFEAVAESLALDLAGASSDWSVATTYAPEVAEPAFHRACGAAHIYVDFWERGGGEPGWGFSLWSGCSMEDRFALADVAVPPTEEVTEWVAPLTREIARALTRAQATSCFRAEC